MASISVNGGPASMLSFASSHGGDLVASLPVIVRLKAGKNTIEFSNDFGWAPDIDKVSVIRKDC